MRTVVKPYCCRGVASPYCAGQPLSRPLHRHDAGAKHPTTRPHVVPLLPPSWLTPRAACLASSSLAPRCVGTIRWHTHEHRVATTSTLPVQLTTTTPAYGQNSHPSRALHGARCCPRCALPRREHTLALPPCRAEPSPPSFSPCAGSYCFYVIHNYKRDIPRAFCPRPHRYLPPVSHRRHTAFVFRRSVGAKPSPRMQVLELP
jgi:hypothetical protein